MSKSPSTPKSPTRPLEFSMSQNISFIFFSVHILPSPFCDFGHWHHPTPPKPRSHPTQVSSSPIPNWSLCTLRSPSWISLQSVSSSLYLLRQSWFNCHSLCPRLSIFLETDRCFSRRVFHDCISQGPSRKPSHTKVKTLELRGNLQRYEQANGPSKEWWCFPPKPAIEGSYRWCWLWRNKRK